MTPNTRHAVGNVHAGQSGAVKKCNMPNNRHAVGNTHAGQSSAVLKRPINTRYAVGDHHAGHGGVTITKYALRHPLDRITTQHARYGHCTSCGRGCDRRPVIFDNVGPLQPTSPIKTKTMGDLSAGPRHNTKKKCCGENLQLHAADNAADG